MPLIVFQPVSTGFALLARGWKPRAGRRKQRRFVSQSGAFPIVSEILTGGETFAMNEWLI
jgi:hypothetical protein